MKTILWTLVAVLSAILWACSEPDGRVVGATEDGAFALTLEAEENHVQAGHSLPVQALGEHLASAYFLEAAASEWYTLAVAIPPPEEEGAAPPPPEPRPPPLCPSYEASPSAPSVAVCVQMSSGCVLVCSGCVLVCSGVFGLCSGCVLVVILSLNFMI